jgi:exodeoxyribonuclease III
MNQEIKIASWNVNGLRAVAKKGFAAWLINSGFDIVCLQETKTQTDQIDNNVTDILGYSKFVLNSGERKGYSGVANYCKPSAEPHKVVLDFNPTKFDNSSKLPPVISEVNAGKTETTMKYSGAELSRDILNEQLKAFSFEGRVIETWHKLADKEFVLFNIYFPNGGASTERLKFKLEFYEVLLQYLELMKEETPYIVITGDYNTAHHDIDLARPKENTNTSGFMPIERVYLDRLEAQGFVDTYRHFYPDKSEVYTWWSFRTAARERNVGWRIDYFYISKELLPYLKEANVHPDVEGSDHCPVSITLIHQ